MRLAWFGPADLAPHTDMATLVRALASRHQIDVIDERAAHDFVWRHRRHAYDMCVYELDNTPAHQFVWPYLVHYPGVTRLHRLTLQDSRALALERDQRIDDFVREFAFCHPGAAAPVLPALRRISAGSWPMLAVPLLASRVTVVAHAAVAESLGADYPGARVQSIIPGVERLPENADEVVWAAHWPVHGAPLIQALKGFAAGRAVVVFDGPETADWPSVDPQDWRPRSEAPPICVAVDPRDEAHSRRVASRRLAHDAALRTMLGTAAEAWWRRNATVDRAAAEFERVLEDAVTHGDPEQPAGWPSHLSANGLSRAREVLGQFGLELPF
jgi:hypothetical protein